MSFDQVFAFGGVDLTQWLLVEDVRRAIAPPRTIARTDVPGMDGALISDVRLNPVEVTVTCCIARRAMSDVAEARRALAHALRHREPAELYLPDEPGTFLLAVYEGGAEPSGLMQCPTVDLAFLCPDPTSYGRVRSARVGTAATRVRAGGTCKAYPMVTATVGEGAWSIANKTTGEALRIGAAQLAQASNSVVVDMRLQRATVNSADVPVDIESDFWGIEGDCEIQVSGGSAELQWRERWL